MREAFALRKLLIFFQQKYWHIWEINFWKFNETLTNDVVSFEQMGPGNYYNSEKGLVVGYLNSKLLLSCEMDYLLYFHYEMLLYLRLWTVVCVTFSWVVS